MYVIIFYIFLVFYSHFFIILFSVPVTGPELWKSIYGVSNVGQKRGRGRRKGPRQELRSDLNFGQKIGVGKYVCSLSFCHHFESDPISFNVGIA